MGGPGARQEPQRGAYGGGPPSVPPPAEPVAQCDDKCLENGCDNCRIYVTGLLPSVTSDDLHGLFSGIGIIARLKQKRGFKDQWPYAIKIYTSETGKPKGDATVTYEDPAAAHSAGSFFNGHDFKGTKIRHAARVSAPSTALTLPPTASRWRARARPSRQAAAAAATAAEAAAMAAAAAGDTAGAEEEAGGRPEATGTGRTSAAYRSVIGGSACCSTSVCARSYSATRCGGAAREWCFCSCYRANLRDPCPPPPRHQSQTLPRPRFLRRNPTP